MVTGHWLLETWFGVNVTDLAIGHRTFGFQGCAKSPYPMRPKPGSDRPSPSRLWVQRQAPPVGRRVCSHPAADVLLTAGCAESLPVIESHCWLWRTIAGWLWNASRLVVNLSQGLTSRGASTPCVVNLASPVAVVNLAQPVDVVDLAPPVGVVDLAPPVGVVDLAQPVDVVDLSPPVGVVDLAPPVGVVTLASPVDVVDLSPPVGVVDLASPVGVVDLTPPVGEVDLASPVGVVDLASPVGVVNLAPRVVSLASPVCVREGSWCGESGPTSWVGESG